jgi:hypothetical protein
MGYGIDIDVSGAAYVTGIAISSDFPTTPGAFDTSYNGGSSDAFVVKLTADGTALSYSTLLGGNSDDCSFGIAIDTSGAAYVTGQTTSSDFPTTPGAFDTGFNGNWDAFVVKLSADGTALTYATYLGGSGADHGYGIATDTSGSAYVTGTTYSSDFPTTPGAIDTSSNGNYDAFVVKLTAAGSALTYATFLGGISNDYGYAIAIDTSGAAYVTGYTGSTDFPSTPGAFDTSYNGNDDAFVVKLTADGTALSYSTLLGGNSDDYGHAIAIDTSGAAYVTGNTGSSDFPLTPGAFDTSFNGSENAFVAKIVIPSPVPVLSFLSPDNKWAGKPGLTLIAFGTKFTPTSIVRWNGEDRVTTFVSSGKLTAAITAADLATASIATVTVFNPAPGGGTSVTKNFTVKNDVPVITGLSPAFKIQGKPGFTLNVYGKKFGTGAKVRWNGSDRPTTFVNMYLLTATISAADIASAGTASITVFNPTPGGGFSNTATFTINNDVPVITGLSPASKIHGKPGFTLNVYGKKFGTGAKVRWNGSDRPTTFVNMYLLTATISAADIAAAGTASVRVFNPAPGGGLSNAMTFTIQ